MIDKNDKITFFPRSFNEQMTWIDEEVSHIINYNMIQEIREQGREAYGEMGYTHAIKRLFEIIKADPKNKALLREINSAEQELIAFLYGEQGALSEEEILAYWNNYMLAYIAELESQAFHYFLMRGDEPIGVYSSLRSFRDAYAAAIKGLNQEQVRLHVFDETTGRWEHNVDPNKILKNHSPKEREKYKEIECVLDCAFMCKWRLDHVKKDISGYLYEESKTGRNEEESIFVRFEIEHTYQALDAFDWYWGGFNECPDSRTMRDKAKEWYEKYGAELVRISHDTLTFECRELLEDEAKEIIEETAALHAEIIDCDKENTISHIIRKRTFTLWWD